MIQTVRLLIIIFCTALLWMGWVALPELISLANMRYLAGVFVAVWGLTFHFFRKSAELSSLQGLDGREQERVVWLLAHIRKRIWWMGGVGLFAGCLVWLIGSSPAISTSPIAPIAIGLLVGIGLSYLAILPGWFNELYAFMDQVKLREDRKRRTETALPHCTWRLPTASLKWQVTVRDHGKILSEIFAWFRYGLLPVHTCIFDCPVTLKLENVLILGHLMIEEYLRKTEGLVSGCVITDAKDRQYRQQYIFDDAMDKVAVRRADGNGDAVFIPKIIPLDESLVAFFGLYSGDGAKGSEDKKEPGRIVPTISFSQKEKHLVRFAVDQFRRLFPGNIRFTFSLGEDSAYFMAGTGQERLNDYYVATTNVGTPPTLPLATVRPNLNIKDQQYLNEHRPDVPGQNDEYLAFYYQHKGAMERIFVAEKTLELESVGIHVASDITVTASLRRPFKKGARTVGGSSRSDEIHLGGLNGIGELFLKMMHEIEDSALHDVHVSSQGLIQWIDKPSQIGVVLDLYDFFANSPYGQINGAHPAKLTVHGNQVIGQWSRSSEITLHRYLCVDPLWCYVAGLYLAEGSTPKEALFKMFRESPGAMAMGFTSSEGASLELMLRTLRKMFQSDECVDAWKVKVGSQYFPELVVTGLKHGMPMLRGGNSGDGKLRTMEISLSIKEWALAIADAPLDGRTSLLHSDYADRYSHVEPTGSGVARIDFWASSTLCRWYFPLLMFTVFGDIVDDPTQAFY